MAPSVSINSVRLNGLRAKLGHCAGLNRLASAVVDVRPMSHAASVRDLPFTMSNCTRCHRLFIVVITNNFLGGNLPESGDGDDE